MHHLAACPPGTGRATGAAMLPLSGASRIVSELESIGQPRRRSLRWQRYGTVRPVEQFSEAAAGQDHPKLSDREEEEGRSLRGGRQPAREPQSIAQRDHDGRQNGTN